MFPNYPPEELYHQQHVTASPAWCVVLALVSFSRRSGAGASRELNLFKGFSWHPAQQLPLTSGRFYRKVGEKKKTQQLPISLWPISEVVLVVKNLPANTGDVRHKFCPWEESLATHSSILAWRLPWKRSLVGYSSWGLKELGMTEAS